MGIELIDGVLFGNLEFVLSAFFELVTSNPSPFSFLFTIMHD